MAITNSSTADLHIIFVPFPSPGHMIPLVDIAKIMSRRPGIRATVVTTVGNAPRIRPAIAGHDNLTLLTLPFPSETAPENSTDLPTPEFTSDFVDAQMALEGPFEKLMWELDHPPEAIISDSLLPWCTGVASRLQIPRIAFNVCGSFPSMVIIMANIALGVGNPNGASAASDIDVPLELPGLPHPIRMMRSQLATEELCAPDRRDRWAKYMAEVRGAYQGCIGIVMNSFYEMEPGYCDLFRNCIAPQKGWNVGPVSLGGSNQEMTVRGGEYSDDHLIRWLEEGKRPGSVVYVCFGSLGAFTAAQLREMAVGLEACDHPFIWVIRNGGDESEWMPAGFEKRVVGSGKGLIVRGWVPQVLVLNHPNVGGFVTHSGYNSMLEGVASGIPMVTWPLFFDHFFAERLALDVLKIGIPAGSKVSSYKEEERTLISGEQLKEAVNELMGRGEEAEKRRRRAKNLAAMARCAVEEGGSSYKDVTDMIQELVNIKMGKVTAF